MRIILAPAKKMIENNDDFVPRNQPVFLSKSEALLKEMKTMSFEDLKKMWNCSDKIAKENQIRLQIMDLKRNVSPALFSYVGLAYQYMAPDIFTEDALEYVEKHLRILSGFYGVLRPFDGIVPYRLEMQQALPKIGNLYDYWKDSIYKKVVDEDRIIVNLASKEYSKCIEDYLSVKDHFITIIFGESKNNKVIQKGTMAKMARGEMVRWMAENNIIDVERIKAFNLHYHYDENLSTEKEYVFIKD